MSRRLLFNLIAASIFTCGLVLAFTVEPNADRFSKPPEQSQLSAATIPVNATSSAISTIAATSAAIAEQTSSKKAVVVKKTTIEATVSPSDSTSSDEIARIQNPYSAAPLSFDQVNSDTRSALVNILCEPDGSSSLNPISGSGVIIDPSGIILTNAHVAQYVLLSESPEINLSCVIRTGSPAQAEWTAVVLYIPPVWVNEHANEILDEHPTGTGEHDYAFLYITGSVNDSSLPAQFTYLSPDTRPAISFPGDQILVAGYPAEFVGGIAAQYNLYADTSITTVKGLLTFGTNTPDVLSLGGVIEAQSGSSGGAVVNAWDRLVGLIATTSSGTTTADRDLRAISLSYINTDLAAQRGTDLNALLQEDPQNEVQQFTQETAPSLIQLYISQLQSPQQY